MRIKQWFKWLLTAVLAAVTAVIFCVDAVPRFDWQYDPSLAGTREGRVLADLQLAFHAPSWWEGLLILAMLGGLFYAYFFLLPNWEKSAKQKRVWSAAAWLKYLWPTLIALVLSAAWLWLMHHSYESLIFGEVKVLARLGCKLVVGTVFWWILSRTAISFLKYRFARLLEWQKKLAITILAAFLLEIFIFNGRFWLTMFYQPVQIETDRITLLKGIERSDLDNPSSSKFLITWGKATFELKNLNQVVHNVELSLSTVDGKVRGLVVGLSATDDGNRGEYLVLPNREMALNYEPLRIFSINLTGEAQNLRFDFETPANTEVIMDLTLNQCVPFNFMWLRWAIVMGILGMVMVFLPSSRLHQYQLNQLKENKKMRRIVLGLIVAVVVFQELMVWRLAYSPWTDDWWRGEAVHNQYRDLARALAKGELYLGAASEELISLRNPYDFSWKEVNEIEYRFDTAYFNGYYYVYFGVVPVVLFYLPYFLLTGHDLSNSAAATILACLFVAGVWRWLWVLLKNRWPKTPVTLYFLWGLLVILGTGVMFLSHRPLIYNVPMLGAMAFSVWGLAFYEQSWQQKKIWPIVLGSISWALVPGSRPQLLFLGLASMIYYFWPRGMKFQRQWWATTIKQQWRKWLALGVPLLISAGLLMSYNYARFASPFDFGANYNLTAFDMVGRGYDPARIPTTLFGYLFRPPMMSLRFPFIVDEILSTNYLGYMFGKSPLGGLITMTPFLWLLGLVPFVWRELKKEKLLWPICVSVGVGILNVIIAGQVVGFIPRYMSDFALCFCLAAVILMAWQWSLIKNRPLLKKVWLGFLIVSLLAGILRQVSLIGADLYDLGGSVWYYQWSSLIQFWL